MAKKSKHEIILYTIDCPKCRILEAKLEEYNVKYETVTDRTVMEDKGFYEMPMMEIDGVAFNYADSCKIIGTL